MRARVSVVCGPLTIVWTIETAPCVQCGHGRRKKYRLRSVYNFATRPSPPTPTQSTLPAVHCAVGSSIAKRARV